MSPPSLAVIVDSGVNYQTACMGGLGGANDSLHGVVLQMIASRLQWAWMQQARQCEIDVFVDLVLGMQGRRGGLAGKCRKERRTGQSRLPFLPTPVQGLAMGLARRGAASLGAWPKSPYADTTPTPSLPFTVHAYVLFFAYIGSSRHILPLPLPASFSLLCPITHPLPRLSITCRATRHHATVEWMEPASLEAVNHCPSSPDQHGANPATARPDRSSVVPPYWKRHERNPSRMSSFTDDGRPTPISLEDHTDEGSDQCRVLWAKGVTIDDYVVITGTAPGLGAYVVWNCTVETLHVGCPAA